MHKFTVKQTKYIAENTLLLSIQPKRNKDKITFTPGQYAAIGFRHQGRPSPMRCFSIVSSPNNTDEVQFAMRVQGDFTQAIANLEVGNIVFIRGPFGTFVVDPSFDRNVILMAGGIGITPFMSMIRYSLETQSRIPITLLYSCPSQEKIPFYEKLLELEKQNPRFKVAFFITNGPTDTLKGARVLSGRIDETRLNQLTSEQYNRFTYFICGPKTFNKSLKSILFNHSTDPERIVTEEFTPSTQEKRITLLPKQSISRWTYGLTGASLVLGTAFIMVLDLSRALPKIANAEALTSIQTTHKPQTTATTIAPSAVSPAESTTNTSSTTGSNTTSSPAYAPPTTSSSTTNSPSPATTPTATTAPQTQTTTSSPPAPTSYQAPVTSVS